MNWKQRFHLVTGIVLVGSGLSAIPRYGYELWLEPVVLLMGVSYGMVLFLALTNNVLEERKRSRYVFEAVLVLLTCFSVVVLNAYLYPAEFYASIAGLGIGYLSGWLVFLRSGGSAVAA